MTAASPWSVKGIDPKAREVAKDLARRSGMTLGEWLNQMIIEGEADAPPFESEHRYASARETQHSETIATPRVIRRPARLHQRARLQSRQGSPSVRHRRKGRRASAHHPRRWIRFLARMEAAEHRSTLAISGIDQSVMGVLSRIEGGGAGSGRGRRPLRRRFGRGACKPRPSQRISMRRLGGRGRAAGRSHEGAGGGPRQSWLRSSTRARPRPAPP